jgi:ubiquinone/menaquinone biosynthesis C-methylase UbiE
LFDQDLFYGTKRGHLLGSLAREEEVLSLLQRIKPEESLLEVGCSEGHYLHKMKGKCKRTVGVDIEEERIEEAKARNQETEFYLIEPHKGLPFKDREFDWVLCTEVLEHVPDWQKTLAEVKRLAKKFVLLTIPLEKGRWWKTMSRFGFTMKARKHLHALTVKDIERSMPGWKLEYKQLVATPFRWMNKRFNDWQEKNCMYAVFLFARQAALP